MNVSVDNQICNMYTCSSKRVSLTATSIFYLLNNNNTNNIRRKKYVDIIHNRWRMYRGLVHAVPSSQGGFQNADRE